MNGLKKYLSLGLTMFIVGLLLFQFFEIKNLKNEINNIAVKSIDRENIYDSRFLGIEKSYGDVITAIAATKNDIKDLKEKNSAELAELKIEINRQVRQLVMQDEDLGVLKNKSETVNDSLSLLKIQVDKYSSLLLLSSFGTIEAISKQIEPLSEKEFLNLSRPIVKIKSYVSMDYKDVNGARSNLRDIMGTDGIIFYSDANHSLILGVYHGTSEYLKDKLWEEKQTVFAIFYDEKIEVSLPDGKRAAAKVFKSWPKEDMAIYEIMTGNLAVMPLKPEKPMWLGQPVRILGHPRDYITLVSGRISGRDGNKVSIDANIIPGHSGSPVFSIEGDVLGILINGEKGAYGLFVPMNKILPLIKPFMK